MDSGLQYDLNTLVLRLLFGQQPTSNSRAGEGGGLAAPAPRFA